MNESALYEVSRRGSILLSKSDLKKTNQKRMKFFPGPFLLLAVSLLSGCVTASSTSSVPSPSTTETIPPTEIGHISGATSWKLTPSDQPQEYSSHLMTVTTQRDEPKSRRDSLVTQTLYSISTIRNLDAIVFSGSITSFVLQGSSPNSEEPNFAIPIQFSGKLNNHIVSTRIFNNGKMQDQINCENLGQTPINIVQRNLFTLPLELTIGQTWTDSTSSMICSGTLPLMSTIIRTFSVIGESELVGNPVLVLNKNEKTFSQGEGSQGQHRIVIDSQGLASGRLYLDITSGQLIAATITSRTSVSIESSGRIDHFIQNSTELTQKKQ